MPKIQPHCKIQVTPDKIEAVAAVATEEAGAEVDSDHSQELATTVSSLDIDHSSALNRRNLEVVKEAVVNKVK